MRCMGKGHPISKVWTGSSHREPVCAWGRPTDCTVWSRGYPEQQAIRIRFIRRGRLRYGYPQYASHGAARCLTSTGDIHPWALVQASLASFPDYHRSLLVLRHTTLPPGSPDSPEVAAGNSRSSLKHGGHDNRPTASQSPMASWSVCQTDPQRWRTHQVSSSIGPWSPIPTTCD